MRESRALLLACAYDALRMMRSTGKGYPTLSVPMLAVLQMEAEDRGEEMDFRADGTLAVAHVDTLDEVTALARITFNDTQRAIVAARAVTSLEELFATQEVQA